MKIGTIKKIAGVVMAIAGIFGITAYVYNKKEEKEKLDDDNEYLKSGSTTTDASRENLYTGYVKRGLDVILTSLGLVIFSPIFAVISILIYIDDPGPVLFKQKRVGKDCSFFYCHKFRSMKMSTPHDVPTHQLTDPDQYITKVGQILRKTSLDEIPQFWDILRGKMSVIGPRPALWNQDDLVAERDKYGANDVRPGLTGLAQISGRDELEIVEKARIDGEYVSTLSFVKDLKCFMGTIKSVLKHDGVIEGGTGSMAVSRPIEPVDPADVGFEDYGCYKTFNIDKTAHKSVLITGAGSYIGESFRTYCGDHYPNIECTTIDMLDGSWKESVFTGFDTVFHVAGIAHADVGKTPPEKQRKYYEVNTDLAVECCQKSREAGCSQFIFMSSMIIYGGKEYIDEHTLPAPVDFYGDSKWLGDMGVRKLQSDTFKVAVLRPPMIYGRGSKGNYRALSKIAGRIPVFPDYENKRSMLYIENLCEFVAQLALSQEGGIYFPQNAEYTQTSHMVKLIGGILEKKVIEARILGPSVKLAIHIPGKIGKLAGKAFGSSYYDQGLSMYQGLDYQKVGFEESIRLTERSCDFADSKPLVSVIMATYNDKPQYIRESLDSIINQTYRNFELLIMDDSTDEETRAVIDNYGSDLRVHIYREERKFGFVASLNKGLNLAQGKYIARMDGDDVSSSDRFEKQVNYLNAHPHTDILGGQINVIDGNSIVTGNRSYPLGGLNLLAFFMVRTPVAHPTVMFRRSLVDAGYRYNESFPKAEDIDFWIRMRNAGYKFNNLADTIVNFRVESDFMEKRVTDHTQEDYVLKARRGNFTWRRPIFSIADYLMSYVRKLTPDILKSVTYRRENGIL